jgi:hypothetical protein
MVVKGRSVNATSPALLVSAPMRTVILSEATISALLEAHASMAAWHYELWRALRDGGPPRTPDEETRRAFLSRLAADFPEVANVAKGIAAPRLYVPPPPLQQDPPPPEATPEGEVAGG